MAGRSKYFPDALSGTVEFFIWRHHAEIAAIVRRRLGSQYRADRDGTPASLRLWVLNDQELYSWAVREGLQENV